MPNVVTYYRVSSEEQAQKDLSIPAQRKILNNWLESRPDLRLVQEFVDEGHSAFSPANKRPGFTEMIAHCRKGGVDVILVHKLDRFSRNREESILFKSLLKRHKVAVKSITEDFDSDTPQGFLLEGMIEVINQFYSMNLGTEVMKGLKENAERGFYNGGTAPYGYRKRLVSEVPGKKQCKLVLGPDEEVSTVREIFHLSVQEGLGARRIAEHLNKNGPPSPTGGHWHISSVYNILTQRAYIGDTVWNRKRDSKTPKPKGEWVVTENTHPPIIDRETFDRRGNQAKGRIISDHDRTDNVQRPVKHLLSGIIKCGSCGGNYVGRSYSGWKPGCRVEQYRYLCASFIGRGSGACAHVTLYRDWVENKVIDIIRERVCAPERLEELGGMVKKKIEARKRLHGRDQKTVEQRIRATEKKIDNFYCAIGDGMDPTVCKEHIARLEEEKAQLETEAETLQKEDYYQRALENNMAMLHQFAGVFNERFKELPFAVKRQAIEHFIHSITVVDHSRVRIEVKVPFDNNGIKLLTSEVENPNPHSVAPQPFEIFKKQSERDFAQSDTVQV
ncbi:MAG: recombinase family protein [Magnetococcales bacterium]|nr:recombinase family protein [Magnetococcales bacterium]